MNRSALTEAAAALRALLDVLTAVSIDRTAIAAGSLNQTAGSLRAYAETAIAGQTVGAQLVTIFVLLRQAGATFAGIDAVRRQALATSIVSGLAGVVVDAVALQALACQCRLVADTDFTSREQVEASRTALDAAFDASIVKASDDLDQVTVRALVGLRAAVMRDLSIRARPLPKMVSYAFPRRLPALAIAQRLYGDGGRSAEVIAENAVVHPLFMPAVGRALSR